MIPALIGIKKRQTQWFDKNGSRHPVTVVEVTPCSVVQIKTTETDGYTALQLGTGVKKEKNMKKPQIGHYNKARLTEKKPRFLHEIRLSGSDALPEDIKLGSTISVDTVFYPGDTVSVTGTSKGKGFAGGVKRWGFAGGPATHGQSDRHRAPGSIGSGTTPGRVLKGLKMAGRMGGNTVTMRGLHVAGVNPKTHELIIIGLIPGAKDSLVTITRTHAVDRTEPTASNQQEQTAPEEVPGEQSEVKEVSEEKNTDK